MKSFFSIASLLGILLLLTTSCSETKHVSKTISDIPSSANDFGLSVFRELAGDESVLISPFSLSMALAMTSGGAAGTTYEGMAKSIGFSRKTAEEIGDYYEKTMERLSASDTSVVLGIADAIWADKTIRVNDSFEDASKKSFDAEINVSDFNDPATVREINSWCSEKTQGKIDNIIDRLDPDLRVALLNALYFKGEWDFDIPTAKEGEFTAIDGTVENVEMMRFSGHFAYYENDLFQMVELPYGNGSFVMDVLLPREDRNYKETVAMLDDNLWKEMTDALAPFHISVVMPKFKMEYEKDMTDLLKNTAMFEAFSSDADFSRMSDTPLSIGIVKQKTYIDVTENGTEAAAVTFIGMKLTAAPPSEMFSVIADRPFVFAIRECSTGTILFLGQKTKS